MVGIAKRYSQHVGYAAVVARSCAHPQYVVISPLDIEVVVGAEYVHNLVGIRTTIEHIAEYVELVDGELLNKVADGNYEVVGTVDIDDGANDYIYISLLVGVESRLMEQLLNDIREIVG